jgi:phospholipid/cholesterol/gamma-HCH transport system substrate-binding protein
MLVAAAAIVFALGATSASAGDPSYKVELDNAFGLVNGEQFKVAGVPAGTISGIDLCYTDPAAHCQSPMHALVTVQVTQGGFGSFHHDAFCESRPQSLIGEYFLSCDPGHSGPAIAPGSTIPVTHTQSTIPADLLTDIMRMPYRERLTLIINELGAGVAGNAQNLQAALQRAVPALTETDNLLNLLANDSHTLQDLSATANSLVTALANKSGDVQRFIEQANNISTETATQQTALKSTFHDLPGFLEQLRPALQKLGAAAQANTPAVTNLNSSATQIDRLISDLPPFANSARPALQSLGQASVTGKAAVTAAKPTVNILNKFAKPTPELAQNLAIVLHDLDNRQRAVEKDPRSPGGQGYTGLEALLQYVFNQVLAIDYFTPFGHTLALDLEMNTMCTPYATPATIAMNLKQNGTSYRQCYNWLGPNQPGVNETDPSNPSACVPDPGGAPPGKPGPSTSACRLSMTARSNSTRKSKSSSQTTTTASSPASSGASSGSTGGAVGGLKQTVSGILGALAGSSTNSKPAPQPAPSSTSTTSTGSGSSGSGGSVQNLLNYLLSP